jgi:DNA-binding transcriptional MocR family regulator
MQVNVPAGLIDFGIGQPSPSLLPLELIRQAVAHRLSQDDPYFLAYGVEQGDGYLRLALAQFLSEGYGIPVEAEQLFITASASQGLDLICTMLTQAGDTIFVEEPSYFLALRIFTDHRLNVVSLPVDESGLNLEALEEALTRYRPVFLYTIPTFHNPSSATLSVERRQRLAQLSQDHNFTIVADEVYQLLNYTQSPPRPLASYAETGTILSLGSFSKILAPGLRLGWIQARPDQVERFVLSGVVDSGGGLNPLPSAMVRSMLELGLHYQQLNHLKAVYGERSARLSAALREYLPLASFTEPGGGFFTWLRFPEEIDMVTLLHQAQQRHVSYQPGLKFSSQQGLRNYARLSFAYYEAEDLEEGVRRLAQIIK